MIELASKGVKKGKFRAIFQILSYEASGGKNRSTSLL